MPSSTHSCLSVVLAPQLPNPLSHFTSALFPQHNFRSHSCISRCALPLAYQSPGEKLGGQVSVGGVLGFAAGYAVRRIGQLLLLIVGVEILALQLMSKREWVDVRWKKIGRDLSPHVEKGAFQRLVDGVAFKIPFAAAFSGGMYAGLRWR